MQSVWAGKRNDGAVVEIHPEQEENGYANDPTRILDTVTSFSGCKLRAPMKRNSPRQSPKVLGGFIRLLPAARAAPFPRENVKVLF